MWQNYDPQERLQSEISQGTGGAFQVDAAAKLRRSEPVQPESMEELFQARVSVVCPTTDTRQEFHEQLWAVFEAQTWPDKELVVMETYSTSPSAFLVQKAAEDERLVYMGKKVSPERDWSIGAKRNVCTFLATGTWLANFDDDDLYAPCYLDVMVRSLIEQRSEAITLSTYYVFDVRSGTFGWCDQRYASESMRYGYGFSYVFFRKAAMYHPYPNQNMGEDYGFFNTLRKRPNSTALGGNRHVALHVDECGICCHTLHPKATSNSYAKRQVPLDEVLGLDLGELEFLEAYTRRFPLTQGGSKFIGKTERREQKVLVHSALGDFTFPLLVGTKLSEVQQQLHGELHCGGEASDLHLHASPPPDAPSLDTDTVRVGPRRPELWATLPSQRNETPDTEVTVRDLRNQEVSVTVWTHRVVRFNGLLNALVDQHGTVSEGGHRLAKKLRLAQKCGDDGRTYYESCNPSHWLLEEREVFAHGLQQLLDLAALEQGRGLPVVRLHAHGVPSNCFKLVEVPLPATAMELRLALKGLLPPEALLFKGCLFNASGADALEDESRLPNVVTADVFHGDLATGIFTTREMAIRSQEYCIHLLSTPETQELFDELEAGSWGDHATYRKSMFEALPDKVYRPMLQEYGLPVDRRGVMHYSTSVQSHFTPLDHEMVKNWLAIEQLMRNKVGVKAAEAAMGRIYAQLAAQQPQQPG